MKKILFLVLMLFSIINIYAYENDYFNVNIVDTFKEEKADDKTYKWRDSKSKDTLFISISNNPQNNKTNVENFTEKELNNYKKNIEEKINNQIKEYNVKVEVKNLKLEKSNDYTYISYETYWPTLESIGYDIYQKGHVFSTNKYIYAFIYQSDKKVDNKNKNYESIFNSFKLLDSKIEVNFFNKQKVLIIIVLGVIFGLIGYTISALKKR